MHEVMMKNPDGNVLLNKWVLLQLNNQDIYSPHWRLVNSCMKFYVNYTLNISDPIFLI